MYGYGFRHGFSGAVPPWPYVGRGRGGLPRCHYPGWGICGGTPRFSKQDELNYLKQRADFLRAELNWIEERMKDLQDQMQ